MHWSVEQRPNESEGDSEKHETDEISSSESSAIVFSDTHGRNLSLTADFSSNTSSSEMLLIVYV